MTENATGEGKTQIESLKFEDLKFEDLEHFNVKKSILSRKQEQLEVVPPNSEEMDWEGLDKEKVILWSRSPQWERISTYVAALKVIAFHSFRYRKIILTNTGEYQHLWTRTQKEALLQEKNLTDISSNSGESGKKDYFESRSIQSIQEGSIYASETVFDGEKEKDFEEFFQYTLDRIRGKRKLTKKGIPLLRWRTDYDCDLISYFKIVLGAERRKGYNYDFQDIVLRRLNKKKRTPGVEEASYFKNRIESTLKEAMEEKKLTFEEYSCIKFQADWGKLEKTRHLIFKTKVELIELLKTAIPKFSQIFYEILCEEQKREPNELEAKKTEKILLKILSLEKELN